MGVACVPKASLKKLAPICVAKMNYSLTETKTSTTTLEDTNWNTDSARTLKTNQLSYGCIKQTIILRHKFFIVLRAKCIR